MPPATVAGAGVGRARAREVGDDVRGAGRRGDGGARRDQGGVPARRAAVAPGRVPRRRRPLHGGAGGLRGAVRPRAQARLRRPAPLRRRRRVRRLGGAAGRAAVARGGAARARRRGDLGQQDAPGCRAAVVTVAASPVADDWLALDS